MWCLMEIQDDSCRNVEFRQEVVMHVRHDVEWHQLLQNWFGSSIIFAVI